MQSVAKPATIRPVPQDTRYRLVILQGGESGPRIQVVDCERGTSLFDWGGFVARHLINSGQLAEASVARCGCFPCDKHRVCHLAIVAAAARMTLGRLPAPHRFVATTMLKHSDQHLSAAEIRDLIAIDRKGLIFSEVDACLDDLVSWHLIQRITVGVKKVFYDVDTRPHRHVYDPIEGRVVDA